MSEEAKVAWLRVKSRRLLEINQELLELGELTLADEVDERRFKIHKKIRELENEEVAT